MSISCVQSRMLKFVAILLIFKLFTVLADFVTVGSSVKPGFGLKENVTNYPADEINNIIMANAAQYLHVLSADTRRLEEKSGDDSFNVCDASKQIIYPQEGFDDKGETVLVVNVERKNIRQGLMVEYCKTVDIRSSTLAKSESCIKIQDHVRNTVCHQAFTYRRVLAYNTSTSSLYTANLKLPTACQCFLKSGSTHQIEPFESFEPSSTKLFNQTARWI